MAIMILKSQDFIIELANEQMMDFYGKGEEILHKPLLEVFPEIEAHGFIHLLREVIISGTPYYGYEEPVVLIRHGQKELRYFNFVYQPYYDEDEILPTRVLIFANDVSDRITVKKDFLESEERFRTMAEGNDILIAVSDENNHPVYFNDAWVELTGRPIKDLLKLGWVDLIHPDNREEYVNICLSAFEKRNPFTGEFRILNKQGHYNLLLVKGPPRFRRDGSFAGYISSCIDITERKEAEEAIKESSEKFKKLLEALPQMTWTNLPTGEVNFYNQQWCVKKRYRIIASERSENALT